MSSLSLFSLITFATLDSRCLIISLSMSLSTVTVLGAYMADTDLSMCKLDPELYVSGRGFPEWKWDGKHGEFLDGREGILVLVAGLTSLSPPRLHPI